ncbi:MAG TPA: acyl carrier protein [Terriglobia bacterium]|nr:acyl carrier protein [Terriglobia bacterium]
MSSDVLDQVRGIAADVLSVPVEAISPGSSPESLENWDSVHHLNLVLALEEKFSLEFSPEEIDEMRDISKIASLVAGKARPGPA